MPGVTEPTLALVPRAKYRHASAAPLAGLITFRPLHSISLQFRRLHFRSIRSDGRKLPRPSKTAVRPKMPEAAMLRISAKTGNMAARLRPAKKSAIARDASHGQDIGITARGSACRRRQSNSTARLRPVQDAAITVRSAISAPPPFRKLHCSGQKPPNSLVKPNWSDTTAAGYGQVCRARPCCHRVAAHALRSAVVESENLAGAGATAPGNATRRECCWLCGGVGMREQPTLRFSLRCEAGCRLCFPGSRTRDVICNAAHCRIPLAREPSANGFPPSPRATTRPTARFIKDNIVLSSIRLLHCHADC